MDVEKLENLVNELKNDELDAGEKISALKKIIGEAEDAIAGEVAVARANGWSWADLAPVLGTTRQAAHQRYSTLLSS